MVICYSGVFSGGSGEGSPMGESLGSESVSERGSYCEISGAESLGAEYGSELGSSVDISAGELGSYV